MFIKLIVFLFTTLNLFSVGLLTQYYLGKEYIKDHPSYTEKEKNLFLLGLWFPGIWYLSLEGGSYPKEFKKDLLLDVALESDPFQKGIKFNYYIHQKERELFSSIYETKFSSEISFEIKECYLNILQDFFLAKPEILREAKKLLCELLYTDYEIESFSQTYKTSDVINWYYTILASIDTSPLEIPDEITLSNKYKGLFVTLHLTEKDLIHAKKNLLLLSQDKEIYELITLFKESFPSYTGLYD